MKKLEYKGKWIYNWFSNFEPIKITIDGITYPSVENYYQSQKTLDLEERKQFIICTPSKSKFLGRNVTLRKDWDRVKFSIMKKALEIKFAKGTEQANKLLETGTEEIVEWNNWGDRIWGKTLDGRGENYLGLMLMEIRKNLKK